MRASFIEEKGVPALSRLEYQAKRTDLTAWVLCLCLSLLSVSAVVAAILHGGILPYPDAESHLEITNRVVNGTTNGLAQLGYVWLPFQHILMLTTIWVPFMYQTGMAGTVFSMSAYVITGILLYKIAYRLTGRKFSAGIVAAFVFGLSANVLYMQATPMTELLLCCTLTATAYGLQQYADTGKAKFMVFASVSVMLATLTRYESWALLPFLMLAVAVITLRHTQHLSRQLRFRRLVDRMVIFNFWAVAGIAGWLVWNQVIFGNALNFQFGQYAKPSLWTNVQHDPAIGHLGIAAATYWYAVMDSFSLPVLILAAVGLVCFCLIEWREQTWARTLPVLSFTLVVPLFYITMLYTGQRPLHVMEINYGLYNVRFAMLMVLPISIYIGYLTAGLTRFLIRCQPWLNCRFEYLRSSRWQVEAVPSCLVLGCVVVVSVAMLASGNIVTYNEPLGWKTSANTVDQSKVINFLSGRYDNQTILIQSSGNENIVFRYPINKQVYEGTKTWRSDMLYPSYNGITWIVSRCGDTPDAVCRTVPVNQLNHYQQVYHTPDNVYYVYRLVA